MKFSINQATLMKTPMEEFLKVISEASFEGVELRRDETFEYLRDHSVEELKSLLETYNLKVVSWNAIELFSLCSEEEFAGMLDYTERLMNIGNEIGCDLIIAVPSFVDNAVYPEVQFFEKTVERFQILRNLADKYAFRIGFEPLGFPNCSVRFLEDALNIINAAEKDGLPPSGLVIDTFHYFLAHDGIEALKKIPLDKLWLIHCNDSIDKPLDVLQDGDRVMLGEGFFQLKDFVNVVVKMGYNGFFSIELFNEKFWRQPPLEVSKKAIQSMKKLI